MRKNIILLVLAFNFTMLLGQVKKQTLELLPDGQIQLSESTVVGKKYTISVEGTYSMWPQFKDCRGVDAVYVYEVPKEEVDALRWPPEKITIGGIVIDIFPLPHWVGDPKEWKIPPEEMGAPLFKMSMRRYKGFRIDDEPMPNTGYQSLTHKYSIEKIGTGQPFKFQILDSNRSIIEERTIPRYEDNCGKLLITIEYVNDEDTTGNKKDIEAQISDLERWIIDGKDAGVIIKGGLNEKDTTKLSGKKNILGDIDPREIIVISDGKIICDIDSIICNDRKEPFAITLLVDNTESMEGPISESDNSERMKSSKTAITNFVKTLLPEDEVLLMTFNETTSINTEWTKDKKILEENIAKINFEDKLTSVYKAIATALDSLSLNDNPNKALIVLSDGGNTYPPSWEEIDILKIASSKNFPVFIIALGFTQLAIDIDGKEKLSQIANITPKGKLFDIYNAKALDSVYQKLSKEIISDEDCYIYFKDDSCKPGEERWIRIIYTPDDSTIITKVVKYKCPEVTSVREFIYEESKNEYVDSFNLNPNPANNVVELTYSLKHSVKYNISIYNSAGEYLSEIYNGDSENNTILIDTKVISSGIYYITLRTDDFVMMRKLVITK